MSEDLSRRSYIESVEWAREIVNSDPLYLDTETTGFRSNDEVIEISLVDQDGKVVFSELVKPTIEIPQAAINIHGITNEEITQGYSWAAVYPQFMDKVFRRNVIVYNLDFDSRLINQTCKAHGITPMHSIDSWHCAMKEYSKYIGMWDRRKNDYKWWGLDRAHQRFTDNPVHSHRAADDANACRIVVQGMATSVLRDG